MADNLAVTPGSGATVGADDIGGVLYQRVKVNIGADGAAADAGHSANPFRVDPTGTTTQPVSDAGGSLTVDGTVAVSSVGGTVAVSAASLPLPSGAATAAKQPALGTAGTASTDVLTVQGIASMTAIKTDGSAVTQPVSGTVSANIRDGGGTSLTSATRGSERALSVQVVDSSGNQITSFGGSGGTAQADKTTFTEGTTTATPIAGVLNDTISADPTEDQAAAVRITAKRGLHVNLRNVGGTEVGTASNPVQVSLANTAANATAVKVDGSAVTQPVSLASVPSHAVTNAGTFAVQDSEKVADNAGFTDGTTKVLPAGFVYDEVAGTALTENDAAAARINVNRAQVAAVEDGVTRGRYATVTAANALKVDASGVAVPVTDNSSSLTVDAPVGTPVFVRLSDGSSAIATLPVSFGASASGGADAKTWKSDGTDKADVWKASAGTLLALSVGNTNASPRYVRFYNQTTDPGTGDTPVLRFMIPGNAAGAGREVQIPACGIAFATGIALRVTTGAADTDDTAAASNEVILSGAVK